MTEKLSISTRALPKPSYSKYTSVFTALKKEYA